MMGTPEFDYIVVGAGAAGCVIASRLAQDSAITVGVLEAGGPDKALELRIPGANVLTGSDPRFNWAFESAPVAALGNRQLYWAQGRVIGGSGSINGMMYMRGHRTDYDRWAAEGCTGWGYNDVLPYFRNAETNERGASALHGGSGPLKVSAGSATAPICDLFLDAAATSGFPVIDDLNKDVPQAFGHVDMTIGNGVRSSTSTAYLRPAQARGNVTVLTSALVTCIVIEKGVERGVTYVRNGKTQTARVSRGVILSGGAVNSPQLLMLSGIGDPEHLNSLDIPVHADRPEVGRNLQNHPMYKLIYAVTKPISAYSYARPLGALKAGMQYITNRSGVLSRGLFPTSGFFHADEGDLSTEIQVTMAPAPVIKRKPGVLGILPTEHGFTLLLNHGSPHSRGHVRLKSANPRHHPTIQPNYFSDKRDIGILAKGARRVRDIVHSGPLADVLGRSLSPHQSGNSLADIEDDIRQSAVTHYHPVGTCRMGSDPDSVVDPQLRVRGVDQLFVVDASIMPVLVNGNTYAATIMVAEKAADLIRPGN